MITYYNCNRRKPNDNYYKKLFADFKSDDITVSERSPRSPKNGGIEARKYWRRADEDEARRTIYPVWFKNASWYGRSEYFIKDKHEGGRDYPKPEIIVGYGEYTQHR